MAAFRGCSWGCMLNSETKKRVTIRELVAHGRQAANASRAGRLARAKLRHAVLTRLPDQIVGGALSRRHLAASIDVRKIEVRVPNWPKKFDGMRVGHISDLHVGDLMPVSKALDAVALLAATKPDLIACTGDLVDLDVEGCEPVFKALGALRASMGRYFVLGNHDLLDDAKRVLRLARQAGLTTLRSEMHVVRGGLRIGGIDWSRTLAGNAQEVRSVVKDGIAPHLLLAHNPKAFREAARCKIPLTLAGHTHGGQFALLPNLRKSPRAAASRALRAGHYHEGDSHLFVTTGVGRWFPLRVNCPAEVAIITVRRG